MGPRLRALLPGIIVLHSAVQKSGNFLSHALTYVVLAKATVRRLETHSAFELC